MRLRTEASARFERGLDPNLAQTATQRAIALIQDLLPEATVTAISDVYPHPRQSKVLNMPRTEIKRLMGIDFSDDEILGILSRLDFQPQIVERAP